MLIAFFVSNPVSKYYRSKRFADVLENINRNAPLFELKQNDEKLRILSRNVDSIAKAYGLLKKLQ